MLLPAFDTWLPELSVWLVANALAGVLDGSDFILLLVDEVVAYMVNFQQVPQPGPAPSPGPAPKMFWDAAAE